MERIASFSIDHDKLEKGMYISRTDFGDIVTYDIRMKRPNMDDYLTTGASHTFEHLFATYARNSQFADTIVYIGPMGCRTGCYMVVKGLAHADAIQLVRDSMAFIRDFEGEVPGARHEECGNYADHDLPEARRAAIDLWDVLKDWTVEDLQYQYYL